MTAEASRSLASPVGELVLAATDAGLTSVQLAKLAPARRTGDGAGGLARRHLDATAAALDEYFGGARKQFGDLQPALEGSNFQLSVWRALEQIPFGQTSSYGQLAKRIGRPKASRAVGMANNRNPIAIIVPCHRVVGADGRLVGYAGGIEMKRWLLRHEGAEPPGLFDPTSRRSRT